ncbi:hypothetical protein [Pseudomonas sp. Z3-6]|uniref:hypothetical protein n=1 Tax=Pseudomonas sp. Z3-6 TaxID=2817411 RepID=UPI003DA881C7
MNLSSALLASTPYHLNHGKMMTAMRWVFLLFVTGLSQVAWGYGDVDRLTGSTIVASGELEQVHCPVSGKYDCLTWPHDLYKFSMQNICFTANVSCGFSCEGFIAQKNQVQTLYVLGSRLDSSAINLYKCPSMS